MGGGNEEVERQGGEHQEAEVRTWNLPATALQMSTGELCPGFPV